MSPEDSKWLVNGLFHLYLSMVSILGLKKLMILTIDPFTSWDIQVGKVRGVKGNSRDLQ